MRGDTALIILAVIVSEGLFVCWSLGPWVRVEMLLPHAQRSVVVGGIHTRRLGLFVKMRSAPLLLATTSNKNNKHNAPRLPFCFQF